MVAQASPVVPCCPSGSMGVAWSPTTSHQNLDTGSAADPQPKPPQGGRWSLRERHRPRGAQSSGMAQRARETALSPGWADSCPRAPASPHSPGDSMLSRGWGGAAAALRASAPRSTGVWS